MLNNLTLCRANVLKYIDDNVTVPVKQVGDISVHPARLYIEVRVTGPVTTPGVRSRFTLNVLVISLPEADTNVYAYIDLANQIHDILQAMSISIVNVGCIVQDGQLRVNDFGFVDSAKTIQQANVVCDFILEA